MVASYKNITFSEKEDLIKKNILLVKKIAWHYQGRVKNIVEIDDLVQIGMLGLITAANNFIEKPGVNFSSYAAFILSLFFPKSEFWLLFSIFTLIIFPISLLYPSKITELKYSFLPKYLF